MERFFIFIPMVLLFFLAHTALAQVNQFKALCLHKFIEST